MTVTPVDPPPPADQPDQASSVDRLLAEARSGWHQLAPRQAAEALAAGGLLVDIRPEAQRRLEGEPSGSIVIERNVLEWRLDPTSPHRLPEVSGPDQVIVLICSEGYASSLAVASLHQLGLRRATDVEGGFQAWRRTGLPHRPGERG